MNNISIIVPSHLNDDLSAHVQEILGGGDWEVKCHLLSGEEIEYYIYRTSECDDKYPYAYLIEEIYIPEVGDEYSVDLLIDTPGAKMRTLKITLDDTTQLGDGLTVVKL